MPRFALFTTECAQLGDALTEIIQRHHTDIALVVTSDIYAGNRGGFWRQTARNLRRSGPAFVTYLFLSFVLYPAYLRLDRLRSLLPGHRRTRYSVAELCARHGIRHLRTGRINSPTVLDELQAADLDLIVVYWFDQILREAVITTPRLGVVNVHAAHLPNCRGLFPTLYSALEPDQPYGITAHLIQNREIDAGPVLAQRTCVPDPGHSVLFNDSWINRIGVDMLTEVLADYPPHAAAARPQTGGTYYSYPTRQHLAALRTTGIPLATLHDFTAVCRGTGAAASHATTSMPA
jgi:methionyl-tRNA formyltransferase